MTRKRTMLLAMPALILGGAERLLSGLVAHLTACGWRIIIVSTTQVDEIHGDTTHWFETSAAEIYHLPKFIEGDRWKDFVDDLFESRNVTALWIVGSTFFYEYVPALKMRYPQLKVVDLLFNPVGHTVNNRRYAQCIDLNFVENNEVRQWLLSAGETADRIKLIKSGVDLKRYSPASGNPTVLPQHGVAAGAVIVGFAGRWSEEKDPLAMVEIAKRVSLEVPVVFMIAGAGHLGTALHACVEAAAFPPGRFIIVGSIDDIGPYLKSFDILLLPSRLDGRPNIVMEALASGVSVVASRVGALPEMLEDGKQGFLCEPGNFDEFAGRVAELASDAGKLACFKQQARTYAEQNFDMDLMLDTYAKAFDDLISPV